MPIPVNTIRPEHLGIAYPMLCYFLKLVALGLAQEKVVLVARLGHLKPVVLSYGGMSRRTLAVLVRQLPYQSFDLPSPNRVYAPDQPLILESVVGHHADNHRPLPALLIGHINAHEMGVGLCFAVPGLELRNLPTRAHQLLKTLSQQLVYSLRLTQPLEHTQPPAPDGVQHESISNPMITQKPPIISTCAPLLKPGSTLSPAVTDNSTRWVEFFSSLQACLSLKQLKQLLEIYLPLLLPQHTAKVIALDNSEGNFYTITQWGNDQHMVDLEPKCCGPGTAPPEQEDGLTVCHQCARANQPEANFKCIVLGVLGQNAYVLQFFFSTAKVLTANQICLIQHLSKQLQAVMQRLQLVEDLRTQASQDPLTGLENRRYMQTMLASLCQNGNPDFPVSLIMIDVDHFKRVNDTYGHPAGDAVLKDVSILLKGHVRAKDIVCRYGGEEFCMILLDTPVKIALKRAEKIRRAVKYLNVYFDGKLLRPLTVSIGVAQFPIHGETPDQLIEKADKALYWAKDHGRDQSVSFEQLPEAKEVLSVI